jgi:hypothetical protein
VASPLDAGPFAIPFFLDVATLSAPLRGACNACPGNAGPPADKGIDSAYDYAGGDKLQLAGGGVRGAAAGH